MADGSDKHLVLRGNPASSAPASEEGFKARTQAVYKSRKLPHRRNHGFLHDLAGLFQLIHSGVDELISADYLQASAVNDIGEGRIHTFHLCAQHGG